MRILPIAAVAFASLGLAACSINTAPAPSRAPDVVAVQPVPSAVVTTPAPSSTVVVRP